MNGSGSRALIREVLSYDGDSMEEIAAEPAGVHDGVFVLERQKP
jgi:hypothetical protein